MTDRAGHTATVSLTCRPQRRRLAHRPRPSVLARIALTAAGDPDGGRRRRCACGRRWYPARRCRGLAPTVTLEQLANLTGGGRLPVGRVALPAPRGRSRRSGHATTVYTVRAHD